jgi:hypothetical protein
LAQKNFKLHAGVKKCHFGNFIDRAGMAVPCQYGPQEFLAGFQKIFLLWVPTYEFLAMLEGNTIKGLF